MEQEMIEFALSEKEYSPLVLAFVGDAVYEMYIRSRLVAVGNRGVDRLQKESAKLVCSDAQFKAYHIIEKLLSDEEKAVLTRGRNAKSATVPKNANVTHYRHATGVEALMGYLYISKRHARINELMNIIYNSLRSGDEKKDIN